MRMLLGEGTWGDHHVFRGRVCEDWKEKEGVCKKKLLKVNIEGGKSSEQKIESES